MIYAVLMMGAFFWYPLTYQPFCSLTEQLAAIPDFANLGPLFKSSSLPVELTESETEYVVRCVKHAFSRYMVFQVSDQNLSCVLGHPSLGFFYPLNY